MQTPRFNVVIPARYASTRLPGKPLLLLGGKPMILRTVEQVALSGAANIIVATDDAKVEHVCQQAGVEVMMTSAEHESGTDRIYEVVSAKGWGDQQIVVNVQGDEPFIPPDSIVQVAEILSESAASIATLATPIDSDNELSDPNLVKIVRSKDNNALYFSRAAVPWQREPEEPRQVLPLRHIGIYGYRCGTLRRFATVGACALERLERLEQLRALWHGWPIEVGIARDVPGPGVDTPHDLALARARFENR